MEPVRRILCPVDFSHASQLALDFAERLAQSLGAEILLVHAFDKPESLTHAGQLQPADPEIARKFQQVGVSASDIHVERLLHAGPPGEVICWTAQDRGCDLIVMGTHGHGGLLQLLFGSITEYVLRHARCPVLTVRDRPSDEPPLKEPLVLPVPAPRYM